MESENTRGLYVTERIKNLAYNVKYKALAYLQEYPLEEALSSYQTIFLLGREYTANPANIAQKNKQLAQHFKNILWITYRSGFPQLLKDCGHGHSFVTDTGWGCMIRVGQMLFAQILKSHLQPKSKQDYNRICNYFNDFRPQSLFSIQRIARMGKCEFDLNPGEWYNPAQIAYILSGFLNQNKEQSLRYLKSHVFNNSSFFFDQVVQKFKPINTDQCTHIQNKGSICTQCNTSKMHVAVIILLRLGLNSPEPEYLQVLNIMMTWKWFRGVLGGKPKKALYFVGTKEDQYVYLDPHYVQRAKQNMTQEHNYDYFCQSLRLCKASSTDPSLGICFYLNSLDDLNDLYASLKKLKQDKKSNFFIYLDDQTPSYIVKQKEQTFMRQIQDSGQFQVI